MIPPELLTYCECIITAEVFSEPVILKSGHTFDKKSVLKIIDKYKGTGVNPMTRAVIDKADYQTPNSALLKYIENNGNYEFRDLITHEIIDDPVVFIGSDGQNFNRSTVNSTDIDIQQKIESYLAIQQLPTDLKKVTFVSNISLKNLIDEIKNFNIRNGSSAQPDVQSSDNDRIKPINTPPNIRVALNQADRLYDANAFEKALDMYEELKEELTGKDLAHCLHRTGIIKAKMSQHKEAKDDFKQAITELKKDYNPRADLSKYMEIVVDLSQTYRIIANRENAAENFKLSFELCNNAFEESKGLYENRENPKELYLKFHLLEEQLWAFKGFDYHKPFNECVTVGDRSLKQKADKAAEILKDYFKTYSNPAPEIELKGAQCAFIDKAHVDAISRCRNALRRPTERDLDKEIRVKIRLQLALSLYLSEDPKYQEAIEHLQAALMMIPNHRATLKAKAELHMILGEYSMAEKCCDISLRFAPNDHPMLLTQAKAYLRLEKYAEANEKLESLKGNPDLAEDEKKYVNSVLTDFIPAAMNPSKDVEEPSLLSSENPRRLEVDAFTKRVKSNLANLNDKQIQADADVLRQTFLMLIKEKSQQLDHYLKDLFKPTRSKKTLTGLELYLYVFLMQRVTTNQTNREQYKIILDHMSDIQNAVKQNSDAIWWSDPSCSEHAQQYLKSFESESGNWKFKLPFAQMTDPGDGSTFKPGGVVAQLDKFDTIDQKHISHIQEVAEMLQGDEKYAKDRNEWREHITQMLLGNYYYLRINTYYLALARIGTALNDSPEILKNVNTIMRSINEIESSLYQCGAIDATEETCMQSVMPTEGGPCATALPERPRQSAIIVESKSDEKEKSGNS